MSPSSSWLIPVAAPRRRTGPCPPASPAGRSAPRPHSSRGPRRRTRCSASLTRRAARRRRTRSGPASACPRKLNGCALRAGRPRGPSRGGIRPRRGGATGGEAPAQVGATPSDRSAYGAMDMGGNVAEWTADTFRAFPGCPEPPNDDPSAMAIKGGTHIERYAVARCASRRPLRSASVEWHVGFRRARDAAR